MEITFGKKDSDYLIKIKIHKDQRDTWIHLDKKWHGFGSYKSEYWELGGRTYIGFIRIEYLPNYIHGWKIT